MERHVTRWVLDAKYKHGFADEGRTDRFQMCAYALAFDADRVSLVYPTATGTDVPCRGLLHAVVRGKNITIDSMNLRMVQGPEACLAALDKLFCKRT